MNTVECEVWILVDSDGNYTAGTDPENVTEIHETDKAELNGTYGFRMVRLKLQVPLPKPIEVSCVIPEEQENLVAEMA
jgi:hypothetical protein